MKFTTKTIVAIGIGAALFFVTGRFIMIPSPVPNTNITIQYGVLGLIAAVFGPIAGLLVGLIGHTFIDLSYGGAPWFSWVIASGVCGLIMGFGLKGVKVEDGEFGIKGIIRFNIAQVIAHIISWGVVAPALDIFIYAEPAEKLFAQGLMAGISNAVTTAIVGTLLLVAYTATKTKKGSLSKK